MIGRKLVHAGIPDRIGWYSIALHWFARRLLLGVDRALRSGLRLEEDPRTAIGRLDHHAFTRSRLFEFFRDAREVRILRFAVLAERRRRHVTGRGEDVARR